MSERIPGRLRFVESRLEKLPDDRWHAEVILAPAGDTAVTGSAERDRGRDGDVWCVAEATLDAFCQAVQLAPSVLRIRDVVAFEIDEHPAIAVSLITESEGRRRKLFGLCQADDDRARGAALAVLSATNRYFGDS